METRILNNGVEMPVLGFGVYQVDGAVRRSGIPARGAGGYGTDRRARHEAELFPLAPRSADGRMARDYEV